MLIFITFFIGIFLIFVFGYQLVKIILPNIERLEQIGLGYVMGIGLFTLLWFLLNWAGISYTLISGLVLLLSLNIFLFVIDKLFRKAERRKPFVDTTYFKRLNIIEIFLLGVVIFLFISALIQNIYWPIRYWDSLTLYDFRAHLFTQTGFMREAITAGSFFGYPLLTSLAHTWVYILGGTNPSFLYGLLYVSFVAIFFNNLKKMDIGRILVFFLTALVAVSPRLLDHTQWAYTNLPYSIYITLGSIYLYFGIKKNNLRAYIASAILIGLSTWTRSTEPFWISCFVVAFIGSLFIKKWIWPFIYSGILASILLPWRYFKSINESGSVNIPVELVSASGTAVRNFFDFSILRSVFDYVMANVVNMYLAYFIIFTLIIIGKLYLKSKNWIFVLLILLNVGITFGGTLVFATSFQHWHEIPDSLARMVMFIPPMVVFLCAEFITELKNKNERKNPQN